MTLDGLSSWLRCPICCADLDPSAALVIACEHGHSFDVAKRGYVTLLPPRTRVQGDSAVMLDARTRFLDAGHYDSLSAALDEMVAPRDDHRIFDAGCGTGHYLRSLLGSRPAATALAADLSPHAVARAVRGSAGRILGLVADLWAPLPVRDGRASVVLNVFAPRNPAEYARILEPRGVLLVVVPEPDHLAELRAQGRVLGLQDDKLAKLHASLDGFFTLDDERLVRHSVALESADVDALVGMGPSAHHLDGGIVPDPASASAMTVTASMRVLRFQRR